MNKINVQRESPITKIQTSRLSYQITQLANIYLIFLHDNELIIRNEWIKQNNAGYNEITCSN